MDATDEAGPLALGNVGGLALQTELARRRRVWVRETPWMIRLLSIAGLLVVWEIAALIVNPRILPGPYVVGRALVSLDGHFSSGLLTATAVSAEIFLIGFGIAVGAGLITGILIGTSTLRSRMAEPIVNIFWSTPAVALLPLLVSIFGLTSTTQVVVVVLSAYFPVEINTEVAIRNIDPTLKDVAKVLGARRLERVWYFELPATLPLVLAGIRVAVGRAVIGVIVAELFLSSAGLGGKMTYYANFFQIPNYFAALVMFIIFSLVITGLVGFLERRFRASGGART